MDVTLFGFVLFLHIVVVFVAFMMAGVLHAALPALAHASDVREMRSWAKVVHRLDPLFPIAALLLLAFGAWLIHLGNGRFSWTDGWLLTSVIALVVIEGLSGALLAPKAKAAVRQIEEAADGPVPDAVRRAVLEPAIWYLSHVATFGFTGVVFLMATRPAAAWSPVIVLIGVAIGLAVAHAQLRPLRANVTGNATLPGERQRADEAV